MDEATPPPRPESLGLLIMLKLGGVRELRVEGSVFGEPGFGEGEDFNALIKNKLLQDGRFVKGRGHSGY